MAQRKSEYGCIKLAYRANNFKPPADGFESSSPSVDFLQRYGRRRIAQNAMENYLTYELPRV